MSFLAWKDKVAAVIKGPSLMPLYDFFGGLSEFWAAIFGAATIYLAFKGRLDGNFALTITSITGILTAHDALDDYHSRKKRDEGREEKHDEVGRKDSI